MKRLILAAVLAISVGAAQPAVARDPFREHPELAFPRLNIWKPEPAPVGPPLGIYLVTETYAGDSVTRSGPVTTYSTETVHETTGSYARVLESVGTGASSAYDGVAFNGRAALTDGRAVAGTYYENYVRAERGFVPVSVVFFQDDSEIARQSRDSRPRPVAPPAPAAEPSRPPAVAPGQPPTSPARPPVLEGEDPLPVGPPLPPTRGSARLPDRSIEVLRGRRTALSFSGEGVRAWRFTSGECVSLGQLAGAAGDPFVARWDRLAPPSASWMLRFLIDYADGTNREVVVRVAVRAPGLVE
jgi:hypothetical protein